MIVHNLNSQVPVARNISHVTSIDDHTIIYAFTRPFKLGDNVELYIIREDYNTNNIKYANMGYLRYIELGSVLL